MKKKTILVTGGAGYIGSHVNKILQKNGYETVVLDNLSRGNENTISKSTFINGDIQDKNLLNKIFTTTKIDAVMHFAAFIDVGESVTNPAKYYQNNVSATLNLLESMLENNINYFIFSSTAAIYGIPTENTITEQHQKNPINPYGQSKLMVEKILADFDAAFGMKSCILRYFNAAGGDPESDIKYFERPESNLIPLVLKSIENSSEMTIFGTDYATPDGTCIRDYIHVNDLADAHVLGMEKLFADNQSLNYNLGNGFGFSINQVIQTAEKVTGVKVKIKYGPPRAGDPAVLVANSNKAKQELNFSPRYSLEEMIAHAWKAMH